MRFEAPWARRRQEQSDLRPSCKGAREYFEDAALLLGQLDSFPYHSASYLEQLARSPQQTFESIRRQKHSALSRLIEQYERLNPPPAAAECHELFGRRLYAAKTAVERFDPISVQQPGEAQKVLFGMMAPQLTGSDGYGAFDKFAEECLNRANRE